MLLFEQLHESGDSDAVTSGLAWLVCTFGKSRELFLNIFARGCPCPRYKQARPSLMPIARLSLLTQDFMASIFTRGRECWHTRTQYTPLSPLLYPSPTLIKYSIRVFYLYMELTIFFSTKLSPTTQVSAVPFSVFLPIVTADLCPLTKAYNRNSQEVWGFLGSVGANDLTRVKLWKIFKQQKRMWRVLINSHNEKEG